MFGTVIITIFLPIILYILYKQEDLNNYKKDIVPIIGFWLFTNIPAFMIYSQVITDPRKILMYRFLETVVIVLFIVLVIKTLGISKGIHKNISNFIGRTTATILIFINALFTISLINFLPNELICEETGELLVIMQQQGIISTGCFFVDVMMVGLLSIELFILFLKIPIKCISFKLGAFFAIASKISLMMNFIDTKFINSDINNYLLFSEIFISIAVLFLLNGFTKKAKKKGLFESLIGLLN